MIKDVQTKQNVLSACENHEYVCEEKQKVTPTFTYILFCFRDYCRNWSLVRSRVWNVSGKDQLTEAMHGGLVKNSIVVEA